MPLSLEIIIECGENGITNWDKLHFVDLLCIIYGIKYRNAETYLEQKRQETMRKRGIDSITQATSKDFDEL